MPPLFNSLYFKCYYNTIFEVKNFFFERFILSKTEYIRTETIIEYSYHFFRRCSQVVDNSSNWEFLTTEDIKFLGDRPDYVSMGRLLDKAVETVAVRQWLVAVTRRKLSSLASDQGGALTLATAAVIDSTMNCTTELHILTE